MRLFLTFLCVILAAGCSSFRSDKQDLTITSDQPETYATVNGKPCKLPATIAVPRNESVSVSVEKKGFKPVNHTIDTHINGTGVADLIGTIWLIPIIGVLSPGLKSLNETEVSLVLIPEDK